MAKTCSYCHDQIAHIRRPKNGSMVCKTCFFDLFENEIHETIIKTNLFTRGQKVAIAASGGKDSTVLAHIMTTLNQRHDYGLDLFLLSIDEGIVGYRDDSLQTVKRNREQYHIPLKVLSYEQLYGWTMDQIVREIGNKNNCTFCGVFRRQALDRGATIMKADKIVTGHNADDIAETVIMNLLRGDLARLRRCIAIKTGIEGSMPRCKPFKYTYEKEIVMYAYFKKLDYFSTECIYSPNAYRGYARSFLKDLEKIRPESILEIIHSGETFAFKDGIELSGIESNCIEPNCIEPNRIEANRTEANQIEPNCIEPNHIEPNHIEPNHIEPNHIEPNHIEPNHIEPNHIEPNKIKPNSRQCKNKESNYKKDHLPSKHGHIKMPIQMNCINCGYISSNPICKACALLNGLNRGRAKILIET